jgi:hypothetical protein
VELLGRWIPLTFFLLYGADEARRLAGEVGAL